MRINARILRSKTLPFHGYSLIRETECNYEKRDSFVSEEIVYKASVGRLMCVYLIGIVKKIRNFPIRSVMLLYLKCGHDFIKQNEFSGHSSFVAARCTTLLV